MQPGIDPFTKVTQSEYIVYYSTQGRNFTRSNSTNSISFQGKLQLLRLHHLGDSPTQILEKMGRNMDSVETILSQKGRITICSSPKRIRRYLSSGDILRAIRRVE